MTLVYWIIIIKALETFYWDNLEQNSPLKGLDSWKIPEHDQSYIALLKEILSSDQNVDHLSVTWISWHWFYPNYKNRFCGKHMETMKFDYKWE